MSNNYFIGCLHLAHKSILNFEPKLRFGDTVEEHDYILMERIRSVVKNKNDTLYILGDVSWEESQMKLLYEIPGKKILIRGNHDLFDEQVYRRHFDKIMGIICFKGHWVTHAPIHPAELRGRPNIHAHVHSNSVRVKSNVASRKDYDNLSTAYIPLDEDYINVCVENCEGYPINFNDIRDNTFEGVIK